MNATIDPPSTARRGKRFAELVEDAKTRIKEITVDELKQWLTSDKEFILVDLREPQETDKGVIAEPILLPRGILEVKVDETIPDQDVCIVAYCGGGNRSALAADSLQQMGYNNVLSLAGGWRAWQASS